MPDSESRLPELPTDWPNRDCSTFKTVAGLRWHVQRAGSGPTIVLVHGTAGATHTWRALFPLLTPWADVITFDLPGHGFTTGATAEHLSLVGMATAVHTLLDALAVSRPVIGVGHSAGAAVLLQLASTREFAPRSIIGVNSALVSVNALGQMLLPISRELFDIDAARAGIAAMLRNGVLSRLMMRTTGTPLDVAQEARYVDMLTDETRVGAVLRMISRWDQQALQAHFPALQIPITLVHSSNEPWVPFSDLLDATRALPMRTVIDLAPAGHLIPDEKPQVLADIIASAYAALASHRE